MTRPGPPTVLVPLLGLVLGAAAGGPGGDPSTTPPGSELERLHREVQRPVETEDPFADGAVPDLVLLSTTDLNGETDPCG
jgi:hypothetical protein